MFKHTHRKPDPLKLLVIVITVAVLMTSAADAAETEPFYESLNLTDLADGELMITPLGRQGAGLHMSYQGHSDHNRTMNSASLNNQSSSSTSSVFLSVRVPW